MCVFVFLCEHTWNGQASALSRYKFLFLFYFVTLWDVSCTGRKCFAIQWLWLSSRICFNKFIILTARRLWPSISASMCGSVRCTVWHYLHGKLHGEPDRHCLDKHQTAIDADFHLSNDFNRKLKVLLREYPLRWPVFDCVSHWLVWFLSTSNEIARFIHALHFYCSTCGHEIELIPTLSDESKRMWKETELNRNS